MPAPERQWECAPTDRLPIPDEILREQAYKFTIYLSATSQLHGRCVSWDALPGGALRLFGVLSDTSDRPMGVLLRKRMTWRQSIVVAGAPVIVTELLPDERPASVEIAP